MAVAVVGDGARNAVGSNGLAQNEPTYCTEHQLYWGPYTEGGGGWRKNQRAKGVIGGKKKREKRSNDSVTVIVLVVKIIPFCVDICNEPPATQMLARGIEGLLYGPL